ncbi:hypothetical protein Tco_1029895 [Tanacetum coccineum]|uniref:Kinesin motor domain-containing protein n=1 Tax=Tanacetum coccineum TaxID=301880 RepID=A0ABQ5G6F2_9ASTR
MSSRSRLLLKLIQARYAVLDHTNMPYPLKCVIRKFSAVPSSNSTLLATLFQMNVRSQSALAGVKSETYELNVKLRLPLDPRVCGLYIYFSPLIIASLGLTINKSTGDEKKRKEGAHVPSCISPADVNAEETLNMLKYANFARRKIYYNCDAIKLELSSHNSKLRLDVSLQAIRKYHRAINESHAQKRKVPWSNEHPLENKELNAVIGAWFTLWQD